VYVTAQLTTGRGLLPCHRQGTFGEIAHSYNLSIPGRLATGSIKRQAAPPTTARLSVSSESARSSDATSAPGFMSVADPSA
jgi:hypothetical protein